jgi:hypothetical protein
MTARAEDLLLDSLLISKDDRIRDVSDEPGVQEKGLPILGLAVSGLCPDMLGRTDVGCETGSPSVSMGVTTGAGSGPGSMGGFLITDLINFFALFLGPDSFPKMSVIVLFLLSIARGFLADLS